MPALFTFSRGKLIAWSLDYLLRGPVLVKVSARAFLATDCVWSHRLCIINQEDIFHPFARSESGNILVGTSHQHTNDEEGLAASDLLVLSASSSTDRHQLVYGGGTN